MKRLPTILLVLCISTGGIPFATQQSPANIPRAEIAIIVPRIITPLDKVAKGEEFIMTHSLPLPTEAEITGADLSLVSEWPASPPVKVVTKPSKPKRKR